MNWKKITDDSVFRVHAACPVRSMNDKDQYAWWLSQTYHFVCHSTSLLGYALPFLRNEKLKAVFEHHLGEESRHDLLALKDIEKLGREISPVSPYTEAFYQSQYYRIQFEGGESLLGYILFLENLAVTWGKDLYEHLNKTHPQSVLFLKVHAEEDISHVARAIALIGTLSVGDQEKILRNFHYSEGLYRTMLSERNKVVQNKVA